MARVGMSTRLNFTPLRTQSLVLPHSIVELGARGGGGGRANLSVLTCPWAEARTMGVLERLVLVSLGGTGAVREPQLGAVLVH